jgi:hypothetical protein
MKMSDPSKIRVRHAELILESSYGESQGTEVIDGEAFEWWTDGRSRVWFYEAGIDASGEDTIKRFEADTTLYEVDR